MKTTLTKDIIVRSSKTLETQLPVKRYSINEWKLYLLTLVTFDLIMVLFAYQSAYLIRYFSSIPFFQPSSFPSQFFYLGFYFVLSTIWLITAAIAGLYQKQNLLGGTDEYARTFRAASVGLLFVIVAGFLEPSFVVARGWLLLYWAFSFLFVAVGRFVLRRLVYLLRSHGYFLSPTIIVGANDEGLSLARQFLNARSSGLKIVGFLDNKFTPGTAVTDQVRVLGSVKHLDSLVKKYGVEEVILASSAFSSRDHLVDIFQEYGLSNGVNVRLSSGLYEIITTGLTVREFACVPLVKINKVRLTGLDKVLKTALDYGLAIPLLIFAAPILLILAIAIKFDSPGSFLYRRKVVGVNNTHFDAYKFRSMAVNGDQLLDERPELKAELERNQKLKDDPRVTRVGNFLRKLSLDELPQLLNVLKGEMSLVGPRMISPEEMRFYSQYGMNLLTVKPGITGLWQVSGRSDISYQERVRLDMHYIRNWSIWLDLQLLFRTLPAVLKRKGAY